MAIDPSMFPTWPAKSEMAAGANGAAKKASSPKPPSGKWDILLFELIITKMYSVFDYFYSLLLLFNWFELGGGAFKKINDEDEMDSKVAGFALRGIGLPQPANASWNLKFWICSYRMKNTHTRKYLQYLS